MKSLNVWGLLWFFIVYTIPEQSVISFQRVIGEDLSEGG